MHRMKLIAAVASLGLALATCEEATPPAPVGSIGGRVVIEGAGIDGVSVGLSNGGSTVTSGGGAFRFDGVEGGAHTVTISGYPSDATFDRTSASATISTAGQSVTVNFSGSYIRTASVAGAVTVEGDGLSGVVVALTGGPDRVASEMTDEDGRYAFARLRAGTYAVEISGFDSDEVGFSATARNVSVAVDESKVVSFDGMYLRAAGISGRVSVEGEGVEGVTVSLTGGPDNSDATTTTDGDGRYAFAKLREGEYQVGISGYDAVAYEFDMDAMTVTAANNEAAIANFNGMHSRTASVSGRLYLDSNPMNDRLDAGSEDHYMLAGFPVALQGPDEGDVTLGATDSTGMYMFSGLRAGSYRVAPQVNDSLRAMLAKAGLAYNGAATGATVDVAAGMNETAHIPIDIARQTISISARMGNGKEGEAATMGGPVGGVTVKLYATRQDANGDGDALGSATTDSTGMAEFMFERDRDADMLVFAKVTDMPAGYAVTSSETLEIQYGSRRQSHMAGSPVTLVNTRVTLRFSTKSVITARGGGMGLGGWKSSYMVGNDTAKTPFGTSDAKGMTELALTTMADSLPRMYRIALDMKQDSAMGEMFEAARMPSELADEGATQLSYTHDGLNDGMAVDLGSYEVRFTTQTLIVAAHWERDQEVGYSPNVPDGDRAAVAGAVSVELLVPDGAGRLRRYEIADTLEAKLGNPRRTDSKGMVTFRRLPADVEFTVEATGRDGRKVVGGDRAHTRGAALDSKSVGAFGAQSGAGPAVKVCPLGTGQAGKDCSTFAYLWTNNIVWGTVGSRDYHAPSTRVQTGRPANCVGPASAEVTRYRQCYTESQFPDVLENGLTVTLAPSEDNIEPGGNMTATVGGTFYASANYWSDSGVFEFRNVPSGRYKLIVGPHENWQAPPAVDIHLAQTTDKDSTMASWHRDVHHQRLVTKYSQTAIVGFVGNNADGGAELTANEAMAGVKVSLLEGAAGATVLKTTETNSDGVYTFNELVEGVYRVRGESGDDYQVFGPTTYGGYPAAYRTTTITDTITTTAQPVTRRRDGTSHRTNFGLPRWLYSGGVTQPLTHLTNGINNSKAHLVLLRKNAKITGRTYLTNAAGRTKDFKNGIELRLEPCRVPIWAAGRARGCRPGQLGQRLVTTSETMTENGSSSPGSYEFTGLLEGVYRLSVVIPNNFTAHTPTEDWVLVTYPDRQAQSFDYAWKP